MTWEELAEICQKTFCKHLLDSCAGLDAREILETPFAQCNHDEREAWIATAKAAYNAAAGDLAERIGQEGL